jgi:2-keto-4-pentenoate hydratase/2-oxohepta-3-ene-1,7-dioic acid hydratase in catechol pathway
MGLNYKDHAAEVKMPLPTVPILFAKPGSALSGPYPTDIPVPKLAQDGTSDYEAELCVIFSKSGRDIPEEKAMDYVLGFTAVNDVSARTMQLTTSQWGFSKGFDGSCPIGMLPGTAIRLTAQVPCLSLLPLFQIHRSCT